MQNLKEILYMRNKLLENSPLIHSITNPISINQCANVIIALGAKPIMAEHTLEVSNITKKSDALAINLGNITDARIKSIEISSKTAYENNIPFIIDLVGVGISDLRLNLSKNIINNYKPNVIKGNMSEIKSFLNLKSNPKGVDVGEKDKINLNNLDNSVKIAKNLSNKTNSIVLITGKYDIISNSDKTYIVKNGSEKLSNITGSGCMLTNIVSCFLSVSKNIESVLLSTLIINIAAELSQNAKGPGSFLVEFLDNIYNISNEDILKYSNFLIYKE